MPTLRGLHYEWHGKQGPIIVFSHGLLWSARMFEPQVAALSSRFRCLVYDQPGQGRSAGSPGNTVSIEHAYRCALELLRDQVHEPCHFAGLSMGGFVGLRLALREPTRLRSLVLMATAADPEPPANRSKYRLLNTIARAGGLPLIAPRVMRILFGKTFLADPARADERARWRRELLSNSRRIHRAVRGVIEREGVETQLGKIVLPTLVLAGEEEVAIASARSTALARGIRDARLLTIPRAGHTMTVENPAAVNAALEEFWR